MEFEEIFENKRSHHGNYKNQKHHDEERYSHVTPYSHSRHNNYQKWFISLEKIRNNNKLKLIAVLAGLLVISIAIFLFIVFLPLIIKLINYITQNGLQGVLDAITGFLDKIWKGSGK